MLLPYFFISTAQCLLVSAAVLGALPANDLKIRATGACASPVVVIVDDIFKIFPSPASKICSTILQRTPPATAIVTATTTVTSPTTVSGSTTVTFSSGINIESTEATITTTSTATSISTTIITSPTTVSTNVETDTVTAIVTGSTVFQTVTQTQTTYLPVLKREIGVRATASNVGQAFPGVPQPLSSVLLDLATTACNCFLGPVTTPTSTATATTTTRPLVNAISTSTTTVPKSTTTVTSTSTVTNTAITDIASTTTVASTITRPVTLTTTTTQTTTASSTSTIQAPPIVDTYALVSGPKNTAPGCTYNRYVDLTGISNSPDPAGTYGFAVDQCEALCSKPLSDGSKCLFFLYFRLNPATARGADYASCLLDSQPYDPALLQCNYPTQYYVAYRLVT